jgi:hypothetical protein
VWAGDEISTPKAISGSRRTNKNSNLPLIIGARGFFLRGSSSGVLPPESFTALGALRGVR